ncbi:hypothetical protein Ancab_034801 [Ancistrocladus abbreviatus]
MGNSKSRSLSLSVPLLPSKPILHRMHSPSQSSLFSIFFIFILNHLQKSSWAQTDQYQNCTTQKIQCGNLMDIGYPFYGGNRPEYCGYPGFELNCTGDHLEISIMRQKFYVIDIHVISHTLTLAREDYYYNYCPRNFINTTVNFTLFHYTPTDVNITLYYGCSPANQFPFQFHCSVDGEDVGGYFSIPNMTSGFNNNQAVCSHVVTVPAFAPEGEPGQNVNITTVSRALEYGFGLEWDADNEFCHDECHGKLGKCGYNWDENKPACYYPEGPTKTRKTIMIAVAAASVVGLAVLSMVLVLIGKATRPSHKLACFVREERTRDNQNIEAFLKNHGSLAPKKHTYRCIEKITNNFREKLGEGGYGSVYKGKLSDGRLVAVKLLKSSKGNGEGFINEVASISRTNHVNIVTFLGYCFEGGKRALVYEFMPNGSLDKFIHGKDTYRLLGLEMLFQIAIGIAKGLEYLHRGCNTRILHFDIKPHNILLDAEFQPKISDFGLSKLCPQKESVISMSMARGTVGYIAPEVFCRAFGGVSHKSDVYSYGMMVLDMVGCKENAKTEISSSSQSYFPNWIYKKLEQGKERDNNGILNHEEQELMRKMIIVSLWCIQTNPASRPPMNKVVEMLEGNVESLQIPPVPTLYSPPRSEHHFSALPEVSLSGHGL